MRIIRKSKTPKERSEKVKRQNKKDFDEMWTDSVDELLETLNEKFPVPADNPWMIDEPYFSRDGKQRVRFYVHDVMDDRGYNALQTRPVRVFVKTDKETGEQTTYYNRKSFNLFVMKDDELATEIEQTFEQHE